MNSDGPETYPLNQGIFKERGMRKNRLVGIKRQVHQHSQCHTEAPRRNTITGRINITKKKEKNNKKIFKQ